MMNETTAAFMMNEATAAFMMNETTTLNGSEHFLYIFTFVDGVWEMTISGSVY